jgi:hypothetical protein
MEEEIEFVDADTEWQNPKSNSFKDIVMNHLARISTICTKEFKAGYWEHKPIAAGSGVYLSKIYKEDTRDAYINAVDFWHDILLPKFDKEAIANVQKIESDLEVERVKIKDKIDEWKDAKLVSRRLVFRELSLLLKRLDYLQTGSIR